MLFEEANIGNLHVRNHFIRSATYEGKANEDGSPTKEIQKLYEELADGGVGTIITSYAYIAKYEQPAKKQLGMQDDALIEKYREITDVVHEKGAKIIMQIVHGSSSSQADPQHALIYGPSEMMHPVSQLTSQALTKEEIKMVVQQFADAAWRVKQAGFDGVQIHCAHGYLLSQFISPLFNHRKDEYGGSVENRLRIVVEVYQAIRKVVGVDYPIWIKMNTSDEEAGGLTVDEFIEMAQGLSKEGINAIEVSGNKWKTHKADENNYYKEAAMKAAQVISTPIILTGGVRKLSDMEAICAQSKVSFFGFARPLLTNPNFIETLK